jgi:alanine-glyoxylate transaminase/serine-glyoxylate transaminase/serine-pyruvate transaminase
MPRAEILARCNMSLATASAPWPTGCSASAILATFHDLMVTGTLTGVRSGSRRAAFPYRTGGVEAAMSYLAGNAEPLAQAAE